MVTSYVFGFFSENALGDGPKNSRIRVKLLSHWSRNQYSLSPIIRAIKSQGQHNHDILVAHIVILYKLCYYKPFFIPDGCQIKILDHAGLKHGSNMAKHRQI